MTGMTPAAFRARFPSLRHRVHLAACSLAARSTDLDAALRLMLDDMAAAAPWDRFEERVATARERFAAFVGARPDQVAVLPDASTGAYQVASTMDWRDRPRIVTCGSEFPSVAHVWLAQRPRGAEVVHADDHRRAVDRRTRLVSVPLVSYRDGRRMPVAELAATAHALGAQVFVDAYQGGAAGRIDVSTLDCDFLVLGTSKYLLGLPGLAFLYAREPERTDRTPRLTGWFGRVDPFAFDPRRLDFAPNADRFRTGTPGVAAVYAACAGLGLLAKTDPDVVRAHVHDLTDLAVDRLTAQGERVAAPPRQSRGAHIALYDPDPAGLGRALATRGIAVAPRGPLVRIAFHYYNNPDDVGALCSALAALRRTGVPTGGSEAPCARPN